MEEKNITSMRLKGLIKTSQNAGGELKLIMEDSLNNSRTERDFECAWYFNLNNYTSRVVSFRNVLAERTGHDIITVGMII
jgi:hypothetical protein